MVDTRPRQNALIGIALRFGTASCFAVMAALIKLGHEAGIATPELMFYRFAFGLPPLIAWIWWQGGLDWRTERPGAHLWRAGLGLAAMGLAFTALSYLPLAEATTIGFTAQLFAVMLSALILGERVGIYRWSAVAAGFAGVFIVMRPAGETLPLAGLLIALASAFAIGSVHITIRRIGRTESTQTTVLWFTLVSLAALGLLMPFHARGHDAAGWAILAGIGLFGGVAQLMLTASLRYAAVAVIAPFDYVQLLWAVVLGWLVWNDRPPETTWIGASVIVASGLYTLYREHRLGRLDRRRVQGPL
ncbi:MAG: DMT family transporter [Sphingomonadaceae bacterium]